MAIQAQVVPIVFQGGIDSKIDSKMTMPGSLTTLENGVFTKGARISKRNGYDLLGEAIIDGAASIGPSDALGVFKPNATNEELIQVGDLNAYSYSEDQSKWVDKGAISSVTSKFKSILKSYNNVLMPDCCINSGLEFYVWRDYTDGTASGSVIDSSSGVQMFLSNFGVTKALSKSKCIAIGTKFFAFYVKDSTGFINFRTIDVSNPTTVSAETAIGGVAVSSGTPAFDVVSDGTNIWVCYYDGANIQLLKLDSSGATVASASFAKVIVNALTLCVSTNVFVYWFNAANGTEYAVYSSALASVLAPTVIDSEITDQTYKIAPIAVSSTAQKVYYSNGPFSTLNQKTNVADVNSSGTVSGNSVVVRSITVISKPFLYDSKIYFWGLYVSALSPITFLFDEDGKTYAKAFNGAAINPNAFSLNEVPAFGSDSFIFVWTVANESTLLGGARAVQFDFKDPNAYISSMLGRNLIFSGAKISAYDGKSITELGFNYPPDEELITLTPAAAGGFIADGVYQYQIVYEWMDNQGQVHRSAPSIAKQTTVFGGGGNGQVTLTIPTLRVTDKKDAAGEVIIQIYRTQASGTVFYNVKQNADPVLYNDTDVDSLTYVDTASNSIIASNELIYTTGDVLDNDTPPSCSILDVYQSRMVVAGLEDPLEFAYSKTQVKGEGVAFSGFFNSRVDPFGGDISAIKLMDDKVVLFKENAIFVVSGEGPNDTGSQNNYTIPQLVTSDNGCPYPKSTVLMPLGIMYKSNKGIYLLGRGLQVDYIGSQVEDYNSQDITSAELIQDKNQVRFLTSSGLTLVYDYFFKQWSTFTNHEGKDAVIWKGVYHYLRNSGQVYAESAAFLDNATGIVLKAATAWLKMAGIQGFQRVRKIGFLGEYKSAHQLQIRVGYDYKPAYQDTYNFDATTVIASSANTYQFRQALKQQKCDSLRIEISDTAPTGESYNMSDISLEVGVKPGINRLKAAQTI